MEKVNLHTPKYTIVVTIKYLHALDSLYEDQQQELSRWITKAKEIGHELINTNLELFLVRQERAILKNKLDFCSQELKEALQESRARKCAKRMKKGRRTMAMHPIAIGT